MGMLSGIMEKLGFDRSTAQQTTTARPTSGTAPGGNAKGSAAPSGSGSASRPAQTAERGAAPSGPASRPAQTAEPGAAQARPASQPPQPSASAPTRPAPMTEVDVIGKLESLAAANPQKLNWRESIVDLLKLLDMDSSLAARKELAQELGCPADKMGDSAQMNMWLHKTVLSKLAENGGNVPKELLN